MDGNVLHWSELQVIKDYRVLGFLLKKETKFGPYPYYEITEKGRRYLQIYSQIQDNLRPYFGIQDHIRLEKQDTEADAWS